MYLALAPAFRSLIYPPRPPTQAEDRHYQVVFPNPGKFYVIGNLSHRYNCLAWAVQVKLLPTGDHYFDAGWDVVGFMARYGYRPTQDADLADIDVWGEWNAMSQRYHIQHYSLKLDGKWTSKLGSLEVVFHERGALVCPGHYGTIIGHFVKCGEPGESTTPPDYTVPYHEHRCRVCTGGGHAEPLVDPVLDMQCKGMT